MEKDALNLINQVIQENKIKENKIANNQNNDLSSKDATKGKNSNKQLKQNIVVNKRRQRDDSYSSSDSDSQDSSPYDSIEEDKTSNKNINKSMKTTSMVSTDSSLENLMISRDLNIKLFTLISSIFCIGTTTLSIIGSLIFERLLTFDYQQKNKNEITMNNTMIYILLGVITFFNIGNLIMISLNTDHMLTKLIYTELNWFYGLTQMSFGSLFLITLLWETDLWTINVCLTISMLTILILAFYFTEIKLKKNMSKGTFIFIYIYISVLFSFISYVTFYNIACIILENMEFQSDEIQTVIYIIVKVGVNGGETILSFVLLTYFKDIFFAYTSAYIECAVFINKDFNLKDENIALFIMVLFIILGIILTIYRYGKKTFGYEEVILEISKDFSLLPR